METPPKNDEWATQKAPHFCPTFFARFLLLSYCIYNRKMVEVPGIEPGSYHSLPVNSTPYKTPPDFRPTYGQSTLEKMRHKTPSQLTIILLADPGTESAAANLNP